jgi:uncharacterized membrane protein YkvA (DUF1232 family)
MAVRLSRKAALVALWSALRAHHRGGPTLGRRLAAIPRMILQTLLGRYDGKWRLLLMTVATAYIISPIDLIPEALFFAVGLIDDTVVLAWLAGAVLSETERFLEWEATRPTGAGKVRPAVGPTGTP